MRRRNLYYVRPVANTYLISAKTETDEKQYSSRVQSPHTAPGGRAFGSEDSTTRASFTMGRNRPVTLDSAPPLNSCDALEKSRLSLLLRPIAACFQILWRLFGSHRWDCMTNDRFVLLQGFTAGGTNDKVLPESRLVFLG